MLPRSSSQRRTLASLASLPLTPAVSAYLGRRGLLEVATDLRFGAVPASPAPSLRAYAGRLVIPSLGPEDNVYDVAFRCVQDHDCKEQKCPKYLFLPAMDKRLYNLRALARAGSAIDITEGQLDAATLEACGLHAVGVPGVDGWKRHHRRLFQGFDRVRVWGDGDEPGRDFARRVAEVLPGADVMMVESGYDINSMFVSDGKEAILAIAEGEQDDPDDDVLGDEWLHDSERPPF